MRSAGMNTSRIFFAAHSRWSSSQDYLSRNPMAGFGQVLMGSFLLRKFRNETYPAPTLTVSGELDGLCRVTRIMEAFYHSILHAHNRTYAVSEFPVVIIAGMSHMQFASGNPPLLVKHEDLRPEISQETAHRQVSQLVSAFVAVHLGSDNSLSILSKAVKTTEVFMEPIVSAFELDGYHNFKPPCNSHPPSPHCQIGSKWSSKAQELMGNLRNAIIDNTETFHPVYQIDPIHLPHIYNNCTAPTTGCILHTATVTQNVYDKLDYLDTGLLPISASEMRVKMSSRQAIMEAVGYKNVDFNTSDGFSICKLINSVSYQRALKNASNVTLARFVKFGEPYSMGEDKGPYDVGSLWIWDPPHYEKTADSEGNDVIEIQSPMLMTPVDFFVKLSAGFHYCKLLSPARAVEWIYVDGLRDHYNIRR